MVELKVRKFGNSLGLGGREALELLWGRRQ